MKDIWIDGGYDSYVNTGWQQINGIRPHFHKHENWVLNSAGSIENIAALYNSHWKEHLALQRRLLVRGIESVDRYLTRSLCTILAGALNRLQHGVKVHLASVAYLK